MSRLKLRVGGHARLNIDRGHLRAGSVVRVESVGNKYIRVSHPTRDRSFVGLKTNFEACKLSE